MHSFASFRKPVHPCLVFASHGYIVFCGFDCIAWVLREIGYDALWGVSASQVAPLFIGSDFGQTGYHFSTTYSFDTMLPHLLTNPCVPSHLVVQRLCLDRVLFQSVVCTRFPRFLNILLVDFFLVALTSLAYLGIGRKHMSCSPSVGQEPLSGYLYVCEGHITLH